jgi:hypothetical protein
MRRPMWPTTDGGRTAGRAYNSSAETLRVTSRTAAVTAFTPTFLTWAIGFGLPALDESRLQAVRDAHTAMVGKVTSLRAVMTVARIENGRWPSLTRCEWWQHGRRGRCLDVHAGFYPRPVDVAAPAWHLRTADRPLGGPEGAARQGSTNLWLQSGFMLNDSPPQWVADTLESPFYRLTGRVAWLDGRSTILVEGQTDRRDRVNFRAWLDPDKNYAVVKFLIWYHDGPFDAAQPHVTMNITAFHEPDRDSGIWFPKESRTIYLALPSGRGERFVVQSVARFEDVVLNEPILLEDLTPGTDPGVELPSTPTGRTGDSPTWLWWFLGAGGLFVFLAAARRPRRVNPAASS